MKHRNFTKQCPICLETKDFIDFCLAGMHNLTTYCLSCRGEQEKAKTYYEADKKLTKELELADQMSILISEEKTS